jgi:hypothetical protein
MCSLGVRFTVACVFNVIFTVKNSKMTLKTYARVKRTPKLHIRNASVIDRHIFCFQHQSISILLIIDLVNPAHGPDEEGCCLTSKYGCCQDNVSPAEVSKIAGKCTNFLPGATRSYLVEELQISFFSSFFSSSSSSSYPFQNFYLLFANFLPTFYQLLPTFCQLSANFLPTFCQLFDNFLKTF